MPEPPPENEMVDAEAHEDLRELRDISELVGRVAAAGVSPELRGHIRPDQKVADRRFPGRQKKIVLHVPGPDQDAPLRDIRFKPGFVLRPDLQIILQNDGLRVQMEYIIRLPLQKLEQVVH